MRYRIKEKWKLGRRGYIMSMLVFTLFVTVLIIAVVNIKSHAVIQDSTADRLMQLKITNLALNLHTVLGHTTCADVKAILESPNGFARVSVDCVHNFVVVSSLDGRYSVRI